MKTKNSCSNTSLRDTVKAAAHGQWRDILASLAGIDHRALDGRHRACPRCGGRDRFRFADWSGNGGAYCNCCFSENNADGFATLMWLADMDFREALHAVADYLGIDTSQRMRYSGHGRSGDGSRARVSRPAVIASDSQDKGAFTPEKAMTLWTECVTNTHRKSTAADQKQARGYLRSRGLEESLELGLAGVLPRMHIDTFPVQLREYLITVEPTESRPQGAALTWWGAAFHLVVPLWSASNVWLPSTIQARRCKSLPADSKLKTKLFPRGSRGRVKGSMFANFAARALLDGKSESRAVIFGEGLTDYLALGIAGAELEFPVLAVPGVENAQSCIGPWVKDRTLAIALDCDGTANRQIIKTAEEVERHGGKFLHVQWPGGAKDACQVMKERGMDALRDIIETIQRLS